MTRILQNTTNAPYAFEVGVSLYLNYGVGLSLMRKLDTYQVAALVIQAIEVVFIGVYFGSYGRSSGMYVSDLLFDMMPYKVLMTVFVILQAIICSLFVCRLLISNRILFFVEIIALAACVIGWITLNTMYLTPDGKTSDTHKYGTLVFMMGMVGYFTFMLFSIRTLATAWGSDFFGFCLFYWIMVLLLVTFILGCVFVSYIFNDDSGGYVFEHSAFMTMVLAHFFFFILESPNPTLPFHADDGYEEILSQPPIPATSTRIGPGDVRRVP